MISILILTKNAGQRFEKVLSSVFNQCIEEKFEVILVDSDSNDETLSIARRFDTKVIKINPQDFGHGRTRNLAVRASNSDYVVMMVQDAIPENENWLRELIDPLKGHNDVAGVFSRQIPYQDASIFEKAFISFYYGPDLTVREKKENISIDDVFFSNVSSAIRRELLMRFAFDEDLIMSEDQAWAKKVLEKGYRLIYNPRSIVYHSHNYSLVKAFQRFFDSGVSLRELGLIELGNYRKGLLYLLFELRYCFRELGAFKFIITFPYFIIYEFLRFSGFILGQQYKKLPHFLRKKLSFHKFYWDVG